jgi:hypothetical protein
VARGRTMAMQLRICELNRQRSRGALRLVCASNNGECLRDTLGGFAIVRLRQQPTAPGIGVAVAGNEQASARSPSPVRGCSSSSIPRADRGSGLTFGGGLRSL